MLLATCLHPPALNERHASQGEDANVCTHSHRRRRARARARRRRRRADRRHRHRDAHRPAGLRPIALTPDMQVFQDGRQVAVDSVRPGGYVTIASMTPIPFRGRNRDRVVAATPAPTTTVVTPAPSAPVSYTGTVSRIDSTTIVLSDGRRIPTTQQTVVLVDDRAVMIAKLEPGTRGVIYPNGQQAAVVGSQPVGTTPETRVITAPAVVVPPEPVKLQGGLREFEASRQAI